MNRKIIGYSGSCSQTVPCTQRLHGWQRSCEKCRTCILIHSSKYVYPLSWSQCRGGHTDCLSWDFEGLLGSWDEAGHLLIIVREPLLHSTGLIFFFLLFFFFNISMYLFSRRNPRLKQPQMFAGLTG